MKPQQEKPATFDKYAGDYAARIRHPIRNKFADSGFFFERKIQILRRFFERRGMDTEKQSWLDIGCGQGDLLRYGRKYFKSAAGCDPSEGMLQACRDLDVRHQGALDTLPFDDTTFDFVTAVYVYHHVPIARRPLLTAEARRVLKPGGIVCIIEHNPQNPFTRLIVSGTPVDADVHLLTAGESGHLLSSANAQVLETRYFLLFPEWLKFALPAEDFMAALPFGGQYAVFAERC